MYSLLFVSLAKPQYKMYCDLVDRTGQRLPIDFAKESEQEKDQGNKEDEIDERKFFSPFIDWCKKFQSFLCCKRPKEDEKTVTLSKALMLDVITLPFGADEDEDGTDAFNNKQIVDYEEALKVEQTSLLANGDVKDQNGHPPERQPALQKPAPTHSNDDEPNKPGSKSPPSEHISDRITSKDNNEIEATGDVRPPAAAAPRDGFTQTNSQNK